MEGFWHSMSFGRMVGDKKMQVGAGLHRTSVDILLSGASRKTKSKVEVNKTMN